MIRSLQYSVFLIFFVLTSASCAKRDALVGTWDFVVKNTPEGDYTGQMVLSKDKNSYQGVLVTNGRESALRDLTIEDNQASFETTASGYDAKVSGKFAEDIFLGKVLVEGYQFPFEAKKTSDKADRNP